MFVSVANAQIAGTTMLVPQNVAGPYSTYFPPGQTGFVPSSGTSTGVPSGVSVKASGTATAMRNGTKIAIPVSITSTVSKAAAGGAAIAAWRIAKAASGPLGIGLAGWEIYNAYKDSGLTVCPPPDFFCKPDPENSKPPIITSGWNDEGNGYPGPYSSPQQICDAAEARKGYGGSYIAQRYLPYEPITERIGRCMYQTYYVSSGADYRPPDQSASPRTSAPVSCPSGYSISGSNCVSDTPKFLPSSEPEIQQAGDTDMGNDPTGSKAKKYWDAANAADAMSRAAGGNGMSPSVMVPTGSPTVVDAPPVTSPQRTTSTESFTDPQGVPQTRTTQQTTTVTPTSSGSGTSTSITYNTSNNTTTTTTTNTSTSTSNPPKIETKTETEPALPPVLPMEFPKDYNKEATQQQIRDELEGKNAPAAPADQAARTGTELAKTDTSLKDLFDGLPNQFTADKTNWFSWVWTPPGGTCNASDYSGSVHGYSVTWDICPTVTKIRDVLGWLFALFAAYIIYGQIFKGSK